MFVFRTFRIFNKYAYACMLVCKLCCSCSVDLILSIDLNLAWQCLNKAIVYRDVLYVKIHVKP